MLGWLDKSLGDCVPRISEESVNRLAWQAVDKKRGMLLLLHNSDYISLSFKYLSQKNNFKEKFNFYHIKNPSEQLLLQLNAKKIPRLVFITKSDSEALKTVVYDSKFRYEPMEEFLNEMIKNHVRFLEGVIEINTNKILKEVCNKKCLLFLVDKSKDEKNEEWEDRMEIMTEAAQKSLENGIEAGFVDLAAHPEVLGSARVQKGDTPTQIIYRGTEKKILRAKYKFSFFHAKELLNLEPKVGDEEYYIGKIWLVEKDREEKEDL